MNGVESSKLYGTTPLVYLFNDEDFEGRDGSTAKSANVNTINDVYRKFFPSYSLPSTGIYQSFKYGNALFLLVDTRTFLNPDAKSFLGSTQINWLVSNLQQASTDSSVGAVFICLTQVWNYVPSAYDWDSIKQNYYSVLEFANEDKKKVGDTVANSFNFNRPTLPNFKSVMMIVGEHHTAFDDGSWNNFGNFPIAVCGPLDYWQQCRGGPYSHGSFHDNENNFCLFNLYTESTSGNTCVTAKGVVSSLNPKRGDQTVWVYDTCKPDTYKGKIHLKCPIDYKEKIMHAFITIAITIVLFLIFFVAIYNSSIKAFSYQHLDQDDKNK